MTKLTYAARSRCRRAAALLVLLMALPVAASAQIPGGFGGMGRRGGFGRRGGPPNGNAAPQAMPTSAEVSRNDPILVLLGRKSELSLSDSQVTQLVRIDASLVDENRPLLAEVDSLNAAGGARDSSSRGAEAPSIDRRRAFANVLHQVRENERRAVDQALALLDDGQRTRAEKLLQAQREKSEKRDGRPRGLP